MLVRCSLSLLLCVAAVRGQSLAAFPHQDLIDPTNGTDLYGTFVNETRLVLKVDVSNLTENATWSGTQYNLIYDLSILEKADSQSSTASIVSWTPSFEHPDSTGHTPFWPPGPQQGWTPFTLHPKLAINTSVTIDSYLDHFDYWLYAWTGSFAIVDARNLENEHGWNITRVVFLSGVFYEGAAPGVPTKTNVSAAAVYLMETEDRPYEFVWWEITPITWVLGWSGDSTSPTPWYWNAEVPKSLEKRLLGERVEFMIDL